MTGPQYNSLLAARYAGAINRQFGEDVRVDTITPELTMIVVLENDRPENAFLRDEFLYAQGVNQAAVAGLVDGVQLRNPLGSNLIATVTAIGWTTSAVSEIVVTMSPSQATDLLVALNGKARDTRNDTNIPSILATSRCVVSKDTTVGSFPNLLEQQTAPATSPQSALCAVPLILAPGGAVRIVTTAVNIGIDVSFAWRERVALPGELQ